MCIKGSDILLVRDFMKPHFKFFYKNNTIKEAAKVLYEYKERAVPVVDSNRILCGIVTRTDILKAIVNRISMSLNIDNVMTKNVVYIHPDNTLEEVWDIPVDSLPVVDNGSHVIGIIDRKDFAALYYHKYSAAKSMADQMMAYSYNSIFTVDEHGIISGTNDNSELPIGKVENKMGKVGELTKDPKLIEVIRTGKAIQNDKLDLDGWNIWVNRAPIFDGYKVVGAISVAAEYDSASSRLEADETYQKICQDYEIMQSIFESLKQGIIFVDTKNIVRFENTAYEEIMGIPKTELVGFSAQERIPNSRMHVVLQTGVAELGEFQVVDEMGRKIVCNRVPIFKDGEIIGAIGEAVFKDIQEVKQILKKGEPTVSSKLLQKSNPDGNVSDGVGFEQIIGRNVAMVRAKSLAARVAPTDTTVLIYGESGTGKDLFAQAIHNASNRRNKKFVVINCAAIPAELLESELFGYDEGAFTGARKGGKKGKLELAEGGTLFLDEIGDMPLPMQAKLLRVLQNRTFEHIGGLIVKKCNVRIIAATNRNLEQMVKKETFREDLYYRMNVITIRIPSLRDRKEDISEMINILMPQICTKANEAVKKFSIEAMKIMCNYSWPGNVREMINILEQIAATIDSMLIQPRHLPEIIFHQNWLKGDFDEGNEADIIKNALKAASGNKVIAAKILGIHRSTLYEKIKKYRL